jgi:hypothetical protein
MFQGWTAAAAHPGIAGTSAICCLAHPRIRGACVQHRLRYFVQLHRRCRLWSRRPSPTYQEYRPLSIAPPFPTSKQSPPWMMAGSLLALGAALVFAFGQ